MMDAVMYGIIPIAKMEKFCSAPPPNVFKKPKTFCWFIKSIACLSVNGTGINVPRRKTININNVNIIFRLMSPTRIKLEIVRNIKSPLFYRPLFRLLLSLTRRIYEPSPYVFSGLHLGVVLSCLLEGSFPHLLQLIAQV